MACSMDMLSVLKLSAPKGPIPEGMKVTALQGPNTLQSANPGPVLGVGGFTLWPMSYVDNRVSFGMVMYDLNWNVVNTVEKQGAGNISQITKNAEGDKAPLTF